MQFLNFQPQISLQKRLVVMNFPFGAHVGMKYLVVKYAWPQKNKYKKLFINICKGCLRVWEFCSILSMTLTQD